MLLCASLLAYSSVFLSRSGYGGFLPIVVNLASAIYHGELWK